MKKRFTEEQIIGFLREAETDIPVKELCGQHGFSEASYSLWRSRFGGMSVPEAKRLKELEAGNARLKKLLAESLLRTRSRARFCEKSGERPVTPGGGAPDERTGFERTLGAAGHRHERQRLRYQPAPDRNAALRAQIVALAQRYHRYGSGVIYLKLRQSVQVVNHKRVERLYAEEKLQVRRRKRRKVPMSDRQPPGRPLAANQVWSMDFVFDRTAKGRVIKSLTVLDDATHEAVAIVAERAISGQGLTRILYRVIQRALSGRMPERARVYQPLACQGRDRGLAAGIQRAATEEIVGRINARHLYPQTGRKAVTLSPDSKA